MYWKCVLNIVTWLWSISVWLIRFSLLIYTFPPTKFCSVAHEKKILVFLLREDFPCFSLSQSRTFVTGPIQMRWQLWTTELLRLVPGQGPLWNALEQGPESNSPCSLLGHRSVFSYYLVDFLINRKDLIFFFTKPFFLKQNLLWEVGCADWDDDWLKRFAFLKKHWLLELEGPLKVTTLMPLTVTHAEPFFCGDLCDMSTSVTGPSFQFFQVWNLGIRLDYIRDF